MASVGSPTLANALKVATIAAVLAMLVLPSLGRCPSLGQEELVMAPAPAMRCSECGPHCTEMCRVSVPPPQDCRSAAIRDCRARCKAGGCDCDGDATRSCTGSCSSGSSCADCMRLTGKQCTSDCNSKCAATCV
ncbi:hypothetical protein VPH35_005696 [Triticum aestivum]